MIQELLSGVMEDRKTSTIPTSSPSQSATSSPSSASAEPQQNLRCPRCDSSNTKFCYYNNYNLTQPRHFCKTCRRYWTKGGALRNVPIGGGCRKTKSSSPSITIAGKTPAGLSKAKPMTSSFDVVGRAPPELLWAGMPHSSHLMALLRASQMQNSSPSPNPNPSFLNPVRVKEEGGLIGGGAMMTEPQLPMFRNESPYQYQQQQQQNMLLSEVPTSSGIQELYQRLRSSSSSMMNNDHLQVIANNASSPGVNANYCLSSAVAAPVTAVSVMSTASSIMEPIPLTGGEFGYWNPMMTWPDISTANGAFP